MEKGKSVLLIVSEYIRNKPSSGYNYVVTVACFVHRGAECALLKTYNPPVPMNLTGLKDPETD